MHLQRCISCLILLFATSSDRLLTVNALSVRSTQFSGRLSSRNEVNSNKPLSCTALRVQFLVPQARRATRTLPSKGPLASQPFRNLDSFDFKSSTSLASSSFDEDNNDYDNDSDYLFDLKTTFSLVAGQSVLIIIAVAAAAVLSTPNYGFGPGINFEPDALKEGILYTAPLFLLAYGLDFIEDQYPALQDVTKATQRSIIMLLGGTFKPVTAVVASGALGLAAGFGEEMLFRGVMQAELADRFGTAIAMGISSLIFGVLHAVTPLYALLATLASVYFGYLYVLSDNLAVPIATHALYDVGALLWAHYLVTKVLDDDERAAVSQWNGPNDNDDYEEAE